MWEIKKVKIRSNKKKIWVDQEFALPSKAFVINRFWHKGKEIKELRAVKAIKTLKASHKIPSAIKVDLDKIEEDGRPHVIAITLDHKLEIVPFDEQKPVYLAHLAFIYPKEKRIEILDFVEEGREGVAEPILPYET